MSCSSTVQKLFTLGEIEHDAPWINYLELGLSSDELPELLALLSDPSLQNAAIDSKEVWLPQHAWRALGQLSDKQAIPQLIASLNDLSTDDDAQQELPTVFAMIGAGAQAPLGEFLLDSKNSELARIIAAQALQKIAQKQPKSRSLSVQLLTKQCAALDAITDNLNTQLICHLLDLDAKESIEEIRALYLADSLDSFAIGDIEDVEIALGLRNERETPRPDYGLVYSRKHHQQPSFIDIPERSLEDELADYLKKYGNNDGVLNCSGLDGFFAAISCAPNTILPSHWMPALWGGEAVAPEFPDKSAANLFTSAAMTFYNQIVRALSSGTYSALFIDEIIEEENNLWVDEWCRGFMRGLALWQPISEQDQLFLDQQLKPITLFGTEDRIDELEQMSPAAIEAQQTLIEGNTRQLFNHFVTQRFPNGITKVETVTNENPKVGRNDPCPCGSGKKFKKCCLH